MLYMHAGGAARAGRQVMSPADTVRPWHAMQRNIEQTQQTKSQADVLRDAGIDSC